MLKADADVISVPAAFTVPTGKAHWHMLLRARAIEAGLFVVAAAQVGHHEDGRNTFGHSLVVDPWGEVLLDMGEEHGVGFADIELSRISEVRSRIPALNHRRPIPEVGDTMIVFDLQCLDSGETFEAWFRSSADYESSARPVSSNAHSASRHRVAKAPMAPRVPRKSVASPIRQACGAAGRDAQELALGRR